MFVRKKQNKLGGQTLRNFQYFLRLVMFFLLFCQNVQQAQTV